ncbi:WD40-repeat-containing domain protein [Suillus subluteus]|nr:WD40-repeat-containing domain protein [Suillus subluteus]
MVGTETRMMSVVQVGLLRESETLGFAHYSVAWSPFHNSRIALASAANFGLVGNGVGGSSAVKLDKQYETQDGIYDNQLVTGSGDGTLKLWDVLLNDFPIRSWHEHSREVFSVDWSNIKKDTFVSSSWDGNVKLWTPEVPRSVTTLHAHLSCVYQALFSPHQPDILATCSTDGTMKIFDLRSPAYATGPATNSFTHPLSAAVLTVPASGTELLTLDWNKYRPFVLATAGVDKMVKVWDCRMIQSNPSAQAIGGVCEIQLPGHEYAVRKVQWSPHRPDILATASYDMTCRAYLSGMGLCRWSSNPSVGGSNLLQVHDPHTEFAAGCSWSLYDEGLIASCGWDEDDPEDIMSASLQTLYDYVPITHSAPGSIFTYTIKPQITLQTPDTQASNWSLHASSIWQSSVHIADHIEYLQLDRFSDRKILRVLELGAGAGLPSIMIARTTPNAAVVASDYPDENLICTLSDNVSRNHASERCWVVSYAWGNDISPLLTPAQQKSEGSALFDIIVAADTLWNPETHVQFINTLCMCLNRSPDARVNVVAGLHTGRYTIQSFMNAVMIHKLQVERVMESEVMNGVQRPWDVTRAESEDERERRKWVVWMVLKWA